MKEVYRDEQCLFTELLGRYLDIFIAGERVFCLLHSEVFIHRRALAVVFPHYYSGMN
jgi:hypothetical protein